MCGLASAFSAYFPPFHRKNTKEVKGSHTPTSVSPMYFHIFEKYCKIFRTTISAFVYLLYVYARVIFCALCFYEADADKNYLPHNRGAGLSSEDG